MTNPYEESEFKAQLILLDHHCFECGYIGKAPVINKKVICPSDKCLVENDVWLHGAPPPLSHRRKT